MERTNSVERVEIPEHIGEFISKLCDGRQPTKFSVIHDGLLTQVFHIQFSDDVTDAIQSLIVKAAKTVNDDYNVSCVYEREILFYGTIVEDYKLFLKQKGMDIQASLDMVPKLHHSDEGVKNVFALEDMSILGFKKAEHNVISQFDQCKSVLEGLAKFHGAAFALKDQNPKMAATKYRHLIHPLYEKLASMDFTAGIEKIFHNCLDTAIHALEPHEAFRIEKLNEMKENIVKEVLSFVAPDQKDPSSILLHGDLSVSNIMFRQKDVCFVDFQHCSYGSCILDLSHFLFTSVHTDLRNLSLPKLLRVYYENLAEQMRQLGSDPEKVFSWNTFQEQLKRYGGYGFIMTLLQIESLLSSIDKETNEITTDKSVKIAGSNFGFTSIKNDMQHHLAGVVRDVIRLGYI